MFNEVTCYISFLAVSPVIKFGLFFQEIPRFVHIVHIVELFQRSIEQVSVFIEQVIGI